MKKVACIVLVTAFAVTSACLADETTVYRDEWGVPHIFAETMTDAAYAMGYAQAEDRLEDIYKNVRMVTGTMAEAFGADHAEMDYIFKMVKNADRCKAYWETAPENVRIMGDNFMRGVEAFVAEHPERKPDYAVELFGWQCAAIGRAMILQWPLGTIMDDLHNKDEAPPFGSNAFAVAPERSAEKCAILMTDPHLTWEGLAVFYEARIHAEGQDLCGYFLMGSPLPAIGHNAHVAWACTTGGPDTSDCYMVKVRKNGPFMVQYEYNGEWRDTEMQLITVAVKDGDPVVQPAVYTHFGPLVEEPDFDKGIAYCGASPYLEAMGVFEQMCLMAKAKDCEEFYKALAMNQLMEQNILFADTKGNIQYVRTGRTPIRPDGFNWSAPVPGDTDATKWLGIHDIKDLVQIKNPPQGYFQNCNVSPAVMMKDSPLTADKYKDYIYNVSWDKNSPRGARLLELLAADDSITIEEAKDYTLNLYDILAKPWQKALKEATEGEGVDRMKEDEAFAKAVKAILGWDGQYTTETTVGALVKFWRLKAEQVVDVVAIAEETSLSKTDQMKLLDALIQAMEEMQAKYGTTEVKWGDINLIGRGGKYFPSPGADFGRGKDKRNLTETVMDVSVHELEKGSGKYVAYNGSGFVMLSFMRPEGVESYSLVCWGQSGVPESPHYVDQAEKLYSNRKFKPTWFNKKDLLQHVESEKTITVP